MIVIPAYLLPLLIKLLGYVHCYPISIYRCVNEQIYAFLVSLGFYRKLNQNKTKQKSLYRPGSSNNRNLLLTLKIAGTDHYGGEQGSRQAGRHWRAYPQVGVRESYGNDMHF